MDPQSGERARSLPAVAPKPAVPASEMATMPPSSDSAPAPEITGHTFGDYELLEELGRGGMGVVYKARQGKLKRLVALKMILTGEHAAAQDLARFQAEAEAVARLHHPNIVQVYEVGQHAGQPYLALELCPGGTLDRKLAGTPLPAEEAARLVQAVARAMYAAHQAGVVHRDLKPQNVLLAADGQPKVTDFGLAKKLDEQTAHTQTGAILGTPSYMAPEQAAGMGKDVGPPADVYALGAVLYECLTGRPPFKAATHLDTLWQVSHDEPVPPRQLQHKVPRDLETVCLKCLHKEPGRRYASALELAEDLRRFLAGEPIHARPVGPAERAVKWVRRRPAVAGLAAALVLVAAAGFAGITWKYLEAEQQTRAKQDALDEVDQKHKETLRLAADLKAERDQTRRELNRADFALYVNRIQLSAREAEQKDAFRAQEVLDECRWDLCGWEWYYLRRRCGAELSRFQIPYTLCKTESLRVSPDGRLIAGCSRHGPEINLWNAEIGAVVRTLRGHTADVHDLCFRPDGQGLASAGSDRAVRIWDMRNGTQTGTLRGHTQPVWSVCFRPDGRALASGGSSWDAAKKRPVGEVRVWDAQTGKELFTLRGGPGPVNHLCFSPDGKLLAASSGAVDSNTYHTGGPGRTVTLWDPARRQLLFSREGLPDAVRAANFSPDGKFLVAGTLQGLVKEWDARTGRELLTLEGGPVKYGMYRACFSPDGRHVAAAVGQAVKVWNAHTGQATYSGEGGLGEILDLAFSPDGRSLAYCTGSRFTAGGTGQVRLLHLRTRQELLPVNSQINPNLAVTFSPGGQRLTLINSDGTITGWDVRTNPAVRTFVGDFRPAGGVCFSPDGRRLASSNGVVRDAQTGRQLFTLARGSAWSHSVCYSPDGKLLVLGGVADSAQVFVADARTGRHVRTLPGHASAITGVCFSPDGRRLASASLDQTVRLWDVQTGRTLRTLKGHRAGVRCVAWSRDAKRLASGDGWYQTPGEIKVWDADTGAELLTLRGHGQGVLGVCFGPDCRRLASASLDKMVRLWDVQTGRPLRTLKGHVQAVMAVCFSPDGRRLASSGLERTVRLWDPKTGQETLTLRGHSHEVLGVCFSPDGRRLASGSVEIKVWETRPEPFRIRGSGPGFARAAFSADGKRIVAQEVPRKQGAQGEVRAWDAATGTEITHCTDPPPTGGGGVAQSPDGERVVIAVGNTNTLEVRRRRDFTPLAQARRRREEAAGVVAWHRQQGADVSLPGDAFAAATHLTRLLASEPDKAMLYRQRMLAQARLERWSEAVGDLARSLETWPEKEWVRQDWWWPGWLWLNMPRERMRAELDRRLEQAPKDWTAWAARAWVRGVSREIAPAAADLAEAVRLAPDRPALWAALARLELLQGHLDRAEAARRQLAALAAADLPTWHEREAMSSTAPAAYWHLGHLIGYRPADLSLRKQRALAAVQLGQWKVAAADLTRYLADNPQDTSSQTVLARACLAAGDRAGYRRACTTLLAASRETPGWAAMDRAWICTLAPGAVADPHQLVKLAEGAIAAKQVGWHTTAGAAHVRAGDPVRAVQRLKEAIAQGYRTPAEKLLLALAYHRLGKPAEARRWLDDARKELMPHREAALGAGAFGAAAQGPLGAALALRLVAPGVWPPPAGWAQRLDLNMLRREAQQLILGKGH